MEKIFNTKNFTWIKKGSQNIATFTITEQYFINLDGANAYNVYFYYNDLDGNPVYSLINRNDKSSFKILSNVKNCIEDFMKTNQVDFIGYSSYEKERHNLYMLMIQNLLRVNDTYSTKKKGKKMYYFLYDKKIQLESLLYINRFMENDDKIKK
jgi:hypothetical protein